MQLVTEADVRRMAPSASARDLALTAAGSRRPSPRPAFSRGMRAGRARTGRGAGAAPSSELWNKIRSNDGTYVVHVENGRAVVTRIGPSGPEPFGAE